MDGSERQAKLHTFPCGAVFVHFLDTGKKCMFNSHSALKYVFEIDDWNRTFYGTTDWASNSGYVVNGFDVVDFINRNGEYLKTQRSESPSKSDLYEKATANLLNYSDLLKGIFENTVDNEKVEEEKEELFLTLNKFSSENGETLLKVKLNLNPEILELIDGFYEDGGNVHLSLYKEKSTTPRRKRHSS
jgi:hypothetical protein